MNIFIKILIIAGIPILAASCIKEKETTSTAYLTNKSQHNVEIRPYKGGIVMSNDTIRIASGQTIQIANSHSRGIQNRAGFSSDYFGQPDDSVIVIFDNVYYVAHYCNSPSVLRPKHYLYENERNLLWYLSYEYSFFDVDKYARVAEYKYTFTNKDYEFAKN